MNIIRKAVQIPSIFVLQWLPELFRLLEILVDTFWYKGILLIYNWSGFVWVETSAKGYPNHR